MIRILNDPTFGSDQAIPKFPEHDMSNHVDYFCAVYRHNVSAIFISIRRDIKNNYMNTQIGIQNSMI